MNTICPKCESDASETNLTETVGVTESGKKWKTITFSCQKCSAVLSIQVNPLSMDIDLLNKIRNMMLSLPK
jgi:transcription elongation factor Elf1